MHLEPLENIARVEEPYHGNPVREKNGDFSVMYRSIYVGFSDLQIEAKGKHGKRT